MVAEGVVFMGTPAYAVPSLRAVAAACSPVLVVTQPDRPAGRGHRLRKSPVREAAEALGLPVLTPTRLGPKTLERLRQFCPRLMVTAAYGRILPAEYLALPARGAYNLHASLLPRWRGPNPIAWAIRAGDEETGVSLMAMDTGVDTGPVVDRRAIPILSSDTTGSLGVRLSVTAAELVTDWLPRLLHEPVMPSAQPRAGSIAAKFAPEESRILWDVAAPLVSAQIRSLLPEPAPWTLVDGERVVIREVSAEWDADSSDRLRTGQIERRGEAWRIGCATGAVYVTLIQPAGRRAMTPGAYVRGLRREAQEAR